MSRATHALIHLDALAHNLACVRRLAAKSRIMAVVKADGYGHGLERVARALAAADAFGVASLEDAQRLRDAGFTQRIVLLSGFDEPADLPLLRRLAADTVVHHPSQLAMLAQAAPGPRIRCWLELDSGMHRLGLPLRDAGAAYARLRDLPAVDPEIVLMTHFARSDEFDAPATGEQIAAFARACADLQAPRSLANSAAVLGWPAAHADWVRPGGALYGISVVAGRCGSDFGLRPAMSLGTRLIAVNHFAAGAAIGYGGDFVCPRPLRIGVAAIGYGDGYPRHVASGTPVLVDGARAPIVGRISMDLMCIDITDLPTADVGSAVLLWGPDLPVEQIAAAAGTIGYELTCSITRRVRFIEASGGEQQAAMHQPDTAIGNANRG